MKMRPYLILISHGDFAKELLRSSEMIVGSMEGVQAVSMSMGEGGAGLREKIDRILAAMPSDAPVIFAVDILSGTPCNVAVEKMIQRENISVVAGLNLGMLLEYWGASDESPEVLADRLVNASKEILRRLEKPSSAGQAGQGEGYED